MNLFSSMDISASGLTAERLRMDVIANNLANANTTRTANGEAFRRQVVIFESREAARSRPAPSSRAVRRGVSPGTLGMGVRVRAIVDDTAPFRVHYDPGHPDADEDGMVTLPNVHPVTEMVDLITASRAYEANVTALNAFKSMAMKALEIGRR